jgi:hypothetical protein
VRQMADGQGTCRSQSAETELARQGREAIKGYAGFTDLDDGAGRQQQVDCLPGGG